MLTSPFDNSQNTATSIASTLFATPKSPAGPSPSGGGTSAVLGASGSTPGVVPGAGTTEADVFRSITSNMGNAFDGGSSLLEQSKATIASGVTPAGSNPRKVTRGIRVKLPDSKINPSVTITATPTYKGTSLEELWVQEYQQNRKAAGASDQTSFGAQAPPTTNLFGAPMKIQDSLVEGAAGTFGVTASQPVTSPLGTPGQQRSTIGTDTGQRTVTGGSASGNPKSATSAGSTFGQPSPIKLERIEELLRRTLLGEELVNTQFHLFSARSSASGRVMKPHVLYANNALLAKSSDYFLDLLGADVNSSDPSLVDLMGDNDVPSSVSMDDYGYEDDSDLDNCDNPIPGTDPDGVKNRSVGSQTFRSQVSVETRPKDGNNSLEHPRTTEPFSVNKDDARSVASSESAVQETGGNNGLGNQTTMRLRSLGNRHILVRDVAFQTWFTLLGYLYTGKFSFLPLSSTTPGVRRASLANSLHAPRCSAKSMYRLASKVKLDYLRDAAFSYICSNLTEHNILKELSSSIVSKYPQLLEMELDILYSHIASRPVVANFASLAQRIAHKELPHGADIIVGIHTRLLKERHPFSLKPARFTLLPNLLEPPELVKADARRSTQSRSDSGGSETIPGVQPQAASDVAVSTATRPKNPIREGKRG
ncbi:hypothetical protein JVT61DRAFT_14313 [Boletus reticuloceps]|uniref:BTB domain-containing protein n=1 Tax=Boletus reticuloceps TaxID=495285 RepID=A0A8I3A423_9AGAM|nr:hypothetical protein JVT61DRAFT_14313 [Boletus reticuloceps]